MSSTYVALLRGINVGGKAQISMPELARVLSSLGFEDVATYIRSGNAVLRADADDEQQIATRIEDAIDDAFGLRAAVMLRTPSDLRAIVSTNPFLADEDDPKKLHVAFLDRVPAAGKESELDPERSPPDRFHLHGRELYLHLPNGMGRSKLTIDYLERRLAVKATARNWNTVVKLLELAG